MKNQARRGRHTQSGSIFFWIFFMVFLFGALSFALTQGMRGGGATLTKEIASLTAQEIVQAGTQIREAVKALQIDGCAETEISFAGGPSEGDYTNPNAPPDKHCDVFDPAGASLRPPDIGDDWGNERLFFGLNVVDSHDNSRNYGTSAPDLTMIRQVRLETCNEINNMLGTRGDFWESDTNEKHGMWESEDDHNGSRGVADALYRWEPFQGDYTPVTGRITINDNSRLNGANNDDSALPPRQGCFCESDDECDLASSPTYYYYNVLIVR